MISYKLKDVIKEYLVENGDTNLNKYARFLQIGLSGLREMNMDFTGTPTTVQIDITDLNTVPLPLDYIQYVRIAIVGSDGNIHELGLNSSMTLKRAYDDCGNPKSSVPPRTNISPNNFNTVPTGSWVSGWEGYSDHYRNGEVMGRFFGMGGGNNANGYYRVDKENGYIQLSNIRGSFIVLEYLSDVALIDDDFVVHPYILESIKAWMYWKSIQRNPSRSLGERQMAEVDYWKAYRQSVRRFNANTVEEWKMALRAGNKAAPKF